MFNKIIISAVIVTALVVGVVAVRTMRMRYNGNAFDTSMVDTFPVYAGVEFAGTLSDVSGITTGVWKVNKTPQEVVGWYVSELEKQGWTIINSNQYAIEAEKSGVKLSVEFTQEEEGEMTSVIANFSTAATTPIEIHPSIIRMEMDDNHGG